MKPADEVLGAVGFSVLSVRPGDTCVTMGVSDLPVVAPSIYLSLMESACVAALMEYLESGETTFLTHSSLEIVGSAAAGVEIRANARVINIEGHKTGILKTGVILGFIALGNRNYKKKNPNRHNFSVFLFFNYYLFIFYRWIWPTFQLFGLSSFFCVLFVFYLHQDSFIEMT
jgi:fluoroacetyl-CoA thioesterase